MGVGLNPNIESISIAMQLIYQAVNLDLCEYHPDFIEQIEGYSGLLDILCPNPVFSWLRFLKTELDLDLSNITNQKELDALVARHFRGNHERIRPGLTADALSTRFAMEAVRAGYPPRLFSFHSLRAGFLCSAVVNGLRKGLKH